MHNKTLFYVIKLFCILSVTSLFLSVAAISKLEDGSSSNKILVCYYGSWSPFIPGEGSFTIEDIDANLCTHLIYAFAVLGDNDEILPANPAFDIDSQGYQRFTDLKTVNPELKTLIAIGGWIAASDKFTLMAADPQKRATFVQSSVKFLQQYNFDGLDLDWEYPANRGGRPEDKENFAILAKELHTEFQKHNLLVTAAIGVTSDLLIPGYDLPSLCQDLDFINLMTFGLQGPWDNKTGHHTSMFSHPNLGDLANSLTESVSEIISLGGCPEKMALGLSTPGKTYTLLDPTQTDIGAPTTGPGDAGPITQQKGVLAYYEICQLSGYTVTSDNYTMAPWAYSGDQWLCYDDIQSITTKTEWALEQGMQGAMVWAVELDDFKGACGGGRYPLLTQIHDTLHTGTKQ